MDINQDELIDRYESELKNLLAKVEEIRYGLFALKFYKKMEYIATGKK